MMGREDYIGGRNEERKERGEYIENYAVSFYREVSKLDGAKADHLNEAASAHS